MKILENRGNNLFFCGYDLVKLARELGTPFFLFSEDALRENLLNLKNSFTQHYDKVCIDYSVKTNNELAVLQILCEEGSDVEVCSGYELLLAEKAGFKGSQVCFDGPCKAKEDIELALDKNIRIFNLDSLEELELLDNLAIERGKTAKITFRVHLAEKGVINKISQLYISKFGIPLSRALEAYRLALKFKNLKPVGISTHIGSQVVSVKAYVNTVKKMLKLASQLEGLGISIEEINIGGGFPVATIRKSSIPKVALAQLGFEFKSKVPKLTEFGAAVSGEFSLGIKALHNRPTLVLEPGRSIVSDMGILVCSVKAVKNHWLFLDASTNFLPEMIFFAQRDVLVANKIGSRAVRPYNIAGKSLNSADVFHLNKRLPVLQTGDTIIILDAGAYSISRACRFTTLSPCVYLVNQQKLLQLIRRKEVLEDILDPMIPFKDISVLYK